MKFQPVAAGAVCSLWMWTAAGAPEPLVSPQAVIPPKPVAGLIEELSNERFGVREEATRQLWKMGEAALPALQAAAASKDPEQAYRARELIRKIGLYITPDTDPSVILLVERYAKASLAEKHALLDKMREKHAWRQILKLYAAETNPELQTGFFQTLADGVAVIAARESLMKGKPEEAREFLEMAPADSAGLLALADFHRSQGTLDAELKRALTLDGPKAAAWQLALYRASGNPEAARAAADRAEEPAISAAMSVLLGDPIPWLGLNPEADSGPRPYKPYTDIAIKRWQGMPVRAADWEPLERAAASRNESERGRGINALFLLGETRRGEEFLVKGSPNEAFNYFDSLEMIPEALAALGLAKADPDYAGWVKERVERLTKDNDAADHGAATDELLLLANFMERRGLRQESEKAFMPPLLELAEKQTEAFTEFLGTLFSDQKVGGGAPELAATVAAAYVGENVEHRPNRPKDDAAQLEDSLPRLPGENLEHRPSRPKDNAAQPEDSLPRLSGENFEHRPSRPKDYAAQPEDSSQRLWDDVVRLAFPEMDDAGALWDWLYELDPAATPAARLEGMLALTGKTHDPRHVRDKWLGLGWKSLEKTPENRRDPVIEKLLLLTQLVPDLASSRKLWGKGGEEGSIQSHLMELPAAGLWNEAAQFFLEQADHEAAPNPAGRIVFHAHAAACLRRAGRNQEAAAQDEWVDKLALGNDAIEIGKGYLYGLDFKRAGEWFGRAALQTDPTDPGYIAVLVTYDNFLMEAGNWKVAASVNEVIAQRLAFPDADAEKLTEKLVYRLQADLGRALTNLQRDRSGSIALLANCQRMCPSSGSLADYFFPAIREAGLIHEHDEWFRSSWEVLAKVVKDYPESENTYNTAGWLASRARRNLVQAQQFLEKALALNPTESNYLDTMAEIHFANGQRAKALEWSARALNYSPNSPDNEVLLRQYEHFLKDPLPK